MFCARTCTCPLIPLALQQWKARRSLGGLHPCTRESPSACRCAELSRVTLCHSSCVRVRVQLIRTFKTCTTDIYLRNECAHVGLSIHAPLMPLSPPRNFHSFCGVLSGAKPPSEPLPGKENKAASRDMPYRPVYPAEGGNLETMHE